MRNDLLIFDGTHYWFDKIVSETGPYTGGPYTEKKLIKAGWKEYVTIAKRKYKLKKLLND